MWREGHLSGFLDLTGTADNGTAHGNPSDYVIELSRPKSGQLFSWVRWVKNYDGFYNHVCMNSLSQFPYHLYSLLFVEI